MEEWGCFMVDTILLVEDTDKYAKWQKKAVRRKFPDAKIIHVTTLLEAHKVLVNPNIYINAVMTDNGYPLVPNGDRCGSKNSEGGAGTLLIKQIRSGYFGELYQDLPISWHTAKINDDKVEKALSYDLEGFEDLTHCYQKGEGHKSYIVMTEHLVQ